MFKKILYIFLLVFLRPLCLSAETIIIDAANPDREISPLLYGTNMYYLSYMNGLKEGIHTQEEYNEQMDRFNQNYKPLVQAMQPKIIRYPGGLDANQHQWKAGIGPIEQRPEHGVDKRIITFGTDEFLRFCESIGAEAMITVGPNAWATLLPFNFNHQLAAQELADWVEYVNAPNDGSNPRGGIDWAAIRAANGHPEPYNVKYWEFGNELYSMQVEDYISAMKIIIPEMKKADPNILVGIVAQDDPSKVQEWDQKIFDDPQARELIDFWIRHIYVPAGDQGYIYFYQNNSTITLPIYNNSGDNQRFVFSIQARGILRQYCVYVDGVKLGTYYPTLLPSFQSTPEIALGPGNHELKIQITNKGGNGQHLDIYELIMQKNLDTGEVTLLDAKNSPELYYTLLSAPDVIANLGSLHLGNKPVFVTEYNAHYHTDFQEPMDNLVCDFRESLIAIDLLNTFIRKGINVATYWLLFDDNWHMGQVEGVALDKRGRGEGYESWWEWSRPTSTNSQPPHLRPFYYISQLYSQYVNGKLLNTQISNRTYINTGINELGIKYGLAGGTSKQLYFIDGIASLSNNSNQLVVVLINRNIKNDINVDFVINNFSVPKTAKVYTISADYPGENNEPEKCLMDLNGDGLADCLPNTKCPNGDCITIQETELATSNSFSFQAKKLSINFIVMGGSSSLLGDANCDGKINTMDIVACINHILTIKQLSETGFNNADIDKNNKINILDIVKIIDLINGVAR